MEAKQIGRIKTDKWVCSESNSHHSHNVPMNNGEYVLVDTPEGLKAIIACPQCGSKNPIGTHTLTLNRGILSIKPSINNRQCCGYHGYLKNGRFTNVIQPPK